MTMDLVKAYHPDTRSMSSGQVLSDAYTFEKARTVIQEMADEVALDLLDKGLVTDQIVLTVGYDVESLTNPAIASQYHGRITTDYYGRKVPYHAHGTANFDYATCSQRIIGEHVRALYDRIVNPALLVRRLTLAINRLVPESEAKKRQKPILLDLFADYEEIERQRHEEEAALARERNQMLATLQLRKKFGKNVLLKGINYAEGATQRERNQQIGGHKA